MPTITWPHDHVTTWPRTNPHSPLISPPHTPNFTAPKHALPPYLAQSSPTLSHFLFRNILWLVRFDFGPESTSYIPYICLTSDSWIQHISLCFLVKWSLITFASRHPSSISYIIHLFIHPYIHSIIKMPYGCFRFFFCEYTISGSTPQIKTMDPSSWTSVRNLGFFQ